MSELSSPSCSHFSLLHLFCSCCSRCCWICSRRVGPQPPLLVPFQSNLMDHSGDETTSSDGWPRPRGLRSDCGSDCEVEVQSMAAVSSTANVSASAVVTATGACTDPKRKPNRPFKEETGEVQGQTSRLSQSQCFSDLWAC